MEMIGLLPAFVLLRKVGLIERLVWDQHELPSDHLLSNGVFLRVFAVLMNQCDHIVMANRQRKRLVQRLLGGSLTAEVTVLANYPDGAFANLPKDELPLEVRDWLEDDAYVLAQGGASANRHFYELVEAIRDFENLKLVVVGPYQQQQVDLIREQYGDEALERILFTDFVPQMRIAAYVDHALTSVVFYDTAGVNRKFCASNRFYQAICRGIPVTVSANPPMRNVVNRHGCGVVVDASSPVDIARGLREIVRSRGAYCQSTIGCSGDFMWENQVDALSRVLRG
jgi:glycosyltransferase involved in cell wall biosynthesis